MFASIFWITHGLESYASPISKFGRALTFEKQIDVATSPRNDNNHPQGGRGKFLVHGPLASDRPLNSAAEPSVDLNSINVREMQVQLKRLGCYRGIIDGEIGSQTKAAFIRFLTLTDADLALEDIGTASAVGTLLGENELICNASWLLANRPEELEGKWGFRADCSKFFLGFQVTGELDLHKESSNGFAGSATNSLGMIGNITGQISGQSVDTIIDWPGLQIAVLLIGSNQSLSLQGVASNGCDVVAWMLASSD